MTHGVYTVFVEHAYSVVAHNIGTLSYCIIIQYANHGYIQYTRKFLCGSFFFLHTEMRPQKSGLENIHQTTTYMHML